MLDSISHNVSVDQVQIQNIKLLLPLLRLQFKLPLDKSQLISFNSTSKATIAFEIPFVMVTVSLSVPIGNHERDS